jgi:hypothetical protein
MQVNVFLNVESSSVWFDASQVFADQFYKLNSLPQPVHLPVVLDAKSSA